MRHEVKKITQIVNELISMLMLDGAEDLQVAIKRNEKETVIDLTNKNCFYSPEIIEKLNDELSVPRQHEIEGYYWQLAGENECEKELSLLGAMTDFAEVTFSDGVLHIHLVREME